MIDDVVGYCEKIDSNEYVIEIHSRGTLYDFVSFLAHECIHMKQYVEKELVHTSTQDLWKGYDFTDTEYTAQPWEVEAWNSQHNLAKDFFKNNLNITIKQSKLLSPRTLKKIDWNIENRFLDNIIEKQRLRRAKK